MWIGWGTREALVVAGMTAVSSSAIVTKLLIELRRLANRETPMILGIMVVEDVFIAFYLAIVCGSCSAARRTCGGSCCNWRSRSRSSS